MEVRSADAIVRLHLTDCLCCHADDRTAAMGHVPIARRQANEGHSRHAEGNDSDILPGRAINTPPAPQRDIPADVRCIGIAGA